MTCTLHHCDAPLLSNAAFSEEKVALLSLRVPPPPTPLYPFYGFLSPPPSTSLYPSPPAFRNIGPASSAVLALSIPAQRRGRWRYTSCVCNGVLVVDSAGIRRRAGGRALEPASRRRRRRRRTRLGGRRQWATWRQPCEVMPSNIEGMAAGAHNAPVQLRLPFRAYQLTIGIVRVAPHDNFTDLV